MALHGGREQCNATTPMGFDGWHQGGYMKSRNADLLPWEARLHGGEKQAYSTRLVWPSRQPDPLRARQLAHTCP